MMDTAPPWLLSTTNTTTPLHTDEQLSLSMTSLSLAPRIRLYSMYMTIFTFNDMYFIDFVDSAFLLVIQLFLEGLNLDDTEASEEEC